MALHVDIVRNEPLAASRHLLASVALDEGHHLDMTTHGTDKDTMWRYLRSLVTADPESEPQVFLSELPEVIDSTYVVATKVHEDDECPYVHPMDTSPRQ